MGFGIMSKMKENKKSMTQNFIDNWLDGDSCNVGELCLTEISEEIYNELYEMKMRTEYFYEQDLFKGYDCLAHPLLKVHIIENYRTTTNENGSYNWCYVFVFKYKGKFYEFVDVGTI